MDEILEELGVSYDDLYKLHTGHRIHNETDDSSSSDDSESLDGNYKPPLYSVDQIKQNVFIVGEQNQKGDAKNSSNTDKHEEIAKKLSSYITKKYCYICKKNGRKSGHYKHANHYHKVRRWLQAELPHITGEKLSSFFCESCNLPLDGNGLAQKHYQSDSHKTKVKSFCLPCLRQIPQLNMHEHINSKKHKQDASENLGIIQRELLLNLDSPENESMLNMKSESDGSRNNDPSEAQRSWTQDQTYFYGNLEESVLSNEGIENNDLQTVSVAIVENQGSLPTEDDPARIIAQKLQEMLSPIYCYICKKNVNMHIFNHHYLEREHTAKLRSWLDKEIKKSGVKIDRNILYCEACFLELGGTSADLKHYETASHQFNDKTYCSICIFRGTPNNVVEHTSNQQHIDNLNKLRNNTKENNKYTKWPKKLTKLITLKECKVCCVKLQTTENADFHYCSDMHNINVKEWLDNYNQYGDNSITTGNNKSKKFNCVFCDGSFSSEQELNDHNDSHFPTLGGNKGRNTRKNSMNISEKLKTPSEPHTQEGLLQEMTVDQPFQVPQQQITLSEENTKYNENSNTKLGLYLLPQLPGVKHDYTQLHKEIRNEMNKLINTVYFSKTLPLDQSLYYLKKINKTLLDASATVEGKVVDESSENSCRNDEQTHKIEDKSTGATKKIKLSNPESSHNNEVIKSQFPRNSWTNINEVIKSQFPRNSWTNIAETAERESVKVKLSMELQRLKLVMSNKSKIPTDLALKYLQSLNQLLETSINSESIDFEVEDIFEADNNKLNMTFLSDTKLQSNLEDELAKLSGTLLDAKQLNVEVSLDLIIQFNVQLESLLQYQRGNDILYEDLSD